jgi:hypothetical protein
MRLQTVHQYILKQLTHSPKTLLELTHGERVAHMSYHCETALVDLANNGLIVGEFDAGVTRHFITKAGRDALEERRSVAAKRHIQAGTVTEIYDGRELRHRVVRDGAYDFLQAPSIMGGQRVFKKGV